MSFHVAHDVADTATDDEVTSSLHPFDVHPSTNPKLFHHWYLNQYESADALAPYPVAVAHKLRSMMVNHSLILSGFEIVIVSKSFPSTHSCVSTGASYETLKQRTENPIARGLLKFASTLDDHNVKARALSDVCEFGEDVQ